LYRILARHRGWLHRGWLRIGWATEDMPMDPLSLGEPDTYLDNVEAHRPDGTPVKPAFPDWRSEAQENPEKASLCNADLRGMHLGHAILSSADLSNADLTRADLSNAKLSGADLSGTHMWGMDLRVARICLVCTRERRRSVRT
jgi:hypothetical protein